MTGKIRAAVRICITIGIAVAFPLGIDDEPGNKHQKNHDAKDGGAYPPLRFLAVHRLGRGRRVYKAFLINHLEVGNLFVLFLRLFRFCDECGQFGVFLDGLKAHYRFLHVASSM